MKASAEIARALRAIADALESDESVSSEKAEDLLPLALASRKAATSSRVVKDAIRDGELRAFGRQRDRSVRRDDLQRWIESRASKPVQGPADDVIDARMRRLADARKKKGRAA